jgi:membrane protein
MTGRLQSVTERAGRTKDQASDRLDQLRSDYELIEAAFQVGELDRRRAGSLLAGGIAFRIFLWLLPAALVAAGVIGLVRPAGSAQPDHVARVLGLGASVVSIVHQATRQSQKGTVALLAIGIPLTLYASMSLVRAFRVAHVLAWEELPRRRGHTIRDGALLSGALIGGIALESAIAYLRHSAGVGLSLLLGLVPVAITGALWLAASTQLPHADADRRALLPGAVIVAVGIAVLHFATIYYFAPKLTRAPALYGSLGTAATLLAWLFLIARLMVSSAFVNATLWRRRAAAAESPPAGDASTPETAKNDDI